MRPTLLPPILKVIGDLAALSLVFQYYGLGLKNVFRFLIHTRRHFVPALIRKAANVAIQDHYYAAQAGDFPQQEPRQSVGAKVVAYHFDTNNPYRLHNV